MPDDDPIADRADAFAALRMRAAGAGQGSDPDAPVLVGVEDLRDMTFDEDRRRERDPAPSQHGDRSERTAGCEVLVVYSPKGGVGTSLIASRLALAAARFSTLRVVLVDLHENGGDVALLTGVRVRRSLRELLAAHAATGPVDIDEVIATHPCGLEILAVKPGEAFNAELAPLDGQAVDELLTLLRVSYDLVIVDTPSPEDRRMVAAVSAADRVLLITVPEEPCVHRAMRWARALAAQGFPLERVGVVHNMDGDGGAAADRITTALDLTLVATVPLAAAAAQGAVNTTDDPADQLGRDPVSHAICELAFDLWPLTGTLASGRTARRRRR